MRFVLLFLVLAVAAAVVWAAVALNNKRTKGLASPDRVSANHLNMARWIEWSLSDEMARAVISRSEQERGRELIDEFYGSYNNRKENR